MVVAKPSIASGNDHLKVSLIFRPQEEYARAAPPEDIGVITDNKEPPKITIQHALGSTPAVTHTLHAIGTRTINEAVLETNVVTSREVTPNTATRITGLGFPPKSERTAFPIKLPAPLAVTALDTARIVAHMITGPLANI